MVMKYLSIEGRGLHLCRFVVTFTEHTLPADLTALCTYASSSVTDMGNTCRITNVRTQSPKISSLASIGACPVNAFTMTTVFPAGFVTFTSGQISVTLFAMSGRFVTYHAVFNTRCITEASIEVRAAFVSSAFSADAVTISEVTSGTFLITLLPIPTRLAFFKKLKENRHHKITHKTKILYVFLAGRMA